MTAVTAKARNPSRAGMYRCEPLGRGGRGVGGGCGRAAGRWLVALVSSRRRFFVTLLLLVAAALAIRTTFVLGVARYDQHFYDAAYYQLQADRVAFGGGFTDPFLPITHPQAPPMPSAQHPPLTVLALTPVAWATNGSQLAMRFAMVVLGAVTVGLVGLLAREIAGD